MFMAYDIIKQILIPIVGSLNKLSKTHFFYESRKGYQGEFVSEAMSNRLAADPLPL